MADGSEYTGAFQDSVTEEQLMHFHQRRLEVPFPAARYAKVQLEYLMEAHARPAWPAGQAVAHTEGIDILAFETLPCLKELRAIARLLQVGRAHCVLCDRSDRRSACALWRRQRFSAQPGLLSAARMALR